MKPMIKKINHVFFLISSAFLFILYPFMLFVDLVGAGVINRLFALVGITGGYDLTLKICYIIFIPWLISLLLKIKVFKD
ncbi:MAG: hypothetical protein IJX04_01215 [Oscillospiraceae bacterium]|nr:hypothetical protein [Oscillospiraceae bacterium]